MKTKINDIAITLSGGQQTQLNVGRALMSSPNFLLLDEPSLGLDQKNIHNLIDILKFINLEKKVSILLADQNPQIINAFKKHILIMSGGSILFDGEHNDFLNKEIFNSFLP